VSAIRRRIATEVCERQGYGRKFLIAPGIYCCSWSLVMNAVRSLLALTIIASLSGGCSEPPFAPTSPSAGGPGAAAVTADQLAGTWSLVSIQTTGQSVELTPPGATYTLSFATGRLSTKADCNSCSAAFTVSGQTLTAGPLMACTRAACPTMAFESAYITLLSGESTATLSARALVLSSDRGELRFAKLAR
jgi:heat shock protein HslJ